jgi:VanZ family protein
MSGLAMHPHRSSAAPLAGLFALLIGYASLFPFTGWRWPGGAALWELLQLPYPPWRVAFDIWSNLLGYMPLGFLIYVARVRNGGRPGWSWGLALLLPALLSYVMEVTQHLVPGRYPSMLDWMLNTTGGLLGATAGALAQWLALIDRWQAARDRWFIRHSAGALVLMLLWPLSLLFPSPFPLGLGLGWERVQDGLIGLLLDVPWAQAGLEAISDMPVALERPPAVLEGLGMMLGLMGPGLLAYSVTYPGWRRLVLVAGSALQGLAATTLSAALNFGPGHALGWLSPSVVPAFACALVLMLPLVAVSQRMAAALGMAVLSALVMLVAVSPADPYFADSLQAWEQGRFIRFHGLAQWLGWLWPYAAMAWLASRLSRSN